MEGDKSDLKIRGDENILLIDFMMVMKKMLQLKKMMWIFPLLIFHVNDFDYMKMIEG